MSLTIRRAVPGDATLVHEYVCRLADYEKLRHEVKATAGDMSNALFSENPRVFCEIAEWDNRHCGIAIWFYNFSTFHGKHGIYLEDLYVDTELRGRGIGKALLRHLAELCLKEGLTRLQWWVLDWNTPSIDFYKSIGAVPQDEWTVFRVSDRALSLLAAS